MIYTHPPLTFKVVLKWWVFIGLVNIFFAFFFWSVDNNVPFATRYLNGSISGLCILMFAALPQIFSKNAGPLQRLSMVFLCCVIGSIAGLMLVSTIMNPISRGLFMFLFMLNIMISSIIIGFLYYWEGIAVTSSRLQEERIKRLDMEQRIVQAKIMLVQTPLEPRFLFDALKQVLNLLDADAAKAKALQMSLIQYLRLSLSKLKKKSHSISQEADMIRAYLDIIKQRPGNHKEYEIHIPENVNDIHIPPMSLHSVAKMIIEYLEASDNKKSTLTINCEDVPDGIRFTIHARGITNFNDADVLSNFQDIRERFRKTFGDKHSLMLMTDPPGSFKVKLKLIPGV